MYASGSNAQTITSYCMIYRTVHYPCFWLDGNRAYSLCSFVGCSYNTHTMSIRTVMYWCVASCVNWYISPGQCFLWLHRSTFKLWNLKMCKNEIENYSESRERRNTWMFHWNWKKFKASMEMLLTELRKVLPLQPKYCTKTASTTRPPGRFGFNLQ